MFCERLVCDFLHGPLVGFGRGGRICFPDLGVVQTGVSNVTLHSRPHNKLYFLPSWFHAPVAFVLLSLLVLSMKVILIKNFKIYIINKQILMINQLIYIQQIVKREHCTRKKQLAQLLALKQKTKFIRRHKHTKDQTHYVTTNISKSQGMFQSDLLIRSIITN